LNTINDIVYENAKESGQQMEEKENMKTNELKLQIGDYVYLQCQPTCAGRKFKPIFEGPFAVNNIISAHLIKLRDPTGKKKLKDPVHINRLRIAHIRAPDPTHCLASSQTESNDTEETQSDNSRANNQDIHVPKKNINIEQPIWRSNRNIIKPVRFRDENFITNDKEIEDSLSTDSRSEKVKRILAKKKHGNSFLYLVQLVGEPSQNARFHSYPGKHKTY
jgi:hypothetical protein